MCADKLETAMLHLRQNQDGYSLHALGHAGAYWIDLGAPTVDPGSLTSALGEPVSGHSIALLLNHELLREPIREHLATDANGQVFLGQLEGVR